MLFESVCAHDLWMYAQSNGGKVFYYLDKSCLEADAVGWPLWAVEVKVGAGKFDTTAAMQLLCENYNWHKPLRSIGVCATQLVTANEQVQLSFFEDESKRIKWETIVRTMDGIRSRFGHRSIDVALTGLDKQLGNLDAKGDHVIHPMEYF